MKTLIKKQSGSTLIPIILSLGFVPLIIHQYEYRTHLSVFDWFPDSAETAVDFFLAYKSFVIMILGAVMLLILALDYKKNKKLSFEPVCGFLIAYAALVLGSGLLSKYRAYAFRGGYEMFEPVWVVLAYILFCYYTYHFVRTGEQAVKVLHWSGIGFLLVSVIGFYQYIGQDFFRTEIGKKIITNPSYWDRLDELKFNFWEGMVYTTLYNVDFLSFFYGLLIPVLVALCLIKRKWWERMVYVTLYLMVGFLFILCLKGAGATSAYPALFAAAAVGGLILLSRRRWTMAVGVVLYVLALTFGVKYLLHIPKVEALIANVNGSVSWEDTFFIKKIDTDADAVVFHLSEDRELRVSYLLDGGGGFSLMAEDGEGNPLSFTVMEDDAYTCVLDDASYGNASIQPVNLSDYYGIGVNIDGKTWYFTNQTDRTYYYVNPVGKPVKIRDVPKVDWFYDDAFSGRGPIWNRTIPLLKKYIVLGIGANNFVLAYPQDDYIFRVYCWGVGNYDVKAHCWLLQQWVENGLLAVLCLLGFYGWYFVRSVRIYRRANLWQGVTWIGFGILLGTLTYMIVSLANDSNVCTAPMFWIMMGLGMAVNRMVVQEQGLFVKAVGGHSLRSRHRKRQRRELNLLRKRRLLQWRSGRYRRLKESSRADKQPLQRNRRERRIARSKEEDINTWRINMKKN